MVFLSCFVDQPKKCVDPLLVHFAHPLGRAADSRVREPRDRGVEVALEVGQIGRERDFCERVARGRGGFGVLHLLRLIAEERHQRRAEHARLPERAHSGAGHEQIRRAHDAGEVAVSRHPSPAIGVPFADGMHAVARAREARLHRPGDARIGEVRIQVDRRQALA